MSIDWAGLAGFGFRLFALPAASKAPANAAWTQFAERAPTAEELAGWEADPTLNAGIVTGAPSGILVLDLSTDAEAALVAEGREIPATARVATATGTHHYFDSPGTPAVRMAPHLRPDGVDILGDGRFAAAPGSVHPSGHVYTWIEAPDAAPIVPAPAWLLAAILAA